ncbi:succinylglutamate desuccinylase/aspartoacylase family protein [Enterococcus sp. 669A]|uniref:Succinylglutamate desuccinylase/aspartoacylase family protein n=1 Tax=Candidatus Enterococcus moelleringii TaxID=2815325 RepID=A0ABS3LEF2_9ENTE|nr:succinylglutamate desuccinylase/aspartoacylase family protein [Enterococcus sp. 669A]
MKEKLTKQIAGTVERLFYQVAGTDLELPVVSIKGQQPGATLLITAGVHGGEYPGIEAAKRLSQEINPSELMGNLIILPCVSQRAFYQRIAFVNPADGKNLNRSFPGKADGTETEKIAYTLETAFFSLADFYLDFHSGDLPEPLEQFVFIPGVGSPETVQQEYEAVQYLDLPFGIPSQSRVGASGCACQMGVPALLIERGGFGERLPAAIDGFVDDVQQHLRFLQILDEPLSGAKPLPLKENIHYLDSPQTGLWYPAFELGDQVEAGQSLGVIEDIFGNVLWEGFAKQKGEILYQVASLPISAGEHLIAYGY